VAGRCGRPEEAAVFAGTWGHAAPAQGGGAAQLGAHRGGGVIHQDEHGIGPGIGVKNAGFNEWLQQSRREFSFLDQVALNARPVAGGAGGQGERASLGCRRGLGAMRTFKMLFQPFQRLAEADPPQVHD